MIVLPAATPVRMRTSLNLQVLLHDDGGTFASRGAIDGLHIPQRKGRKYYLGLKGMEFSLCGPCGGTGGMRDHGRVWPPPPVTEHLTSWVPTNER